jgi:hypothetical protein
MPSFNRFIGIGHLTRTPELRYTPHGTPILTGGLAMNRRFKQGDDLKEEVCFIDFTVWGKQAEAMGQYTRQGRSDHARRAAHATELGDHRWPETPQARDHRGGIPTAQGEGARR